MPVVAQLVRYVVLGFLFALAGIIAIRLLNGSINTNGLLRSKSPSKMESTSPARVQLLIFTVATAGTYLTQVLKSLGTLEMPDVPRDTLIALGGSHALYLGTKAYAFLLKGVVDAMKAKE